MTPQKARHRRGQGRRRDTAATGSQGQNRTCQWASRGGGDVSGGEAPVGLAREALFTIYLGLSRDVCGVCLSIAATPSWASAINILIGIDQQDRRDRGKQLGDFFCAGPQREEQLASAREGLGLEGNWRMGDP